MHRGAHPDGLERPTPAQLARELPKGTVVYLWLADPAGTAGEYGLGYFYVRRDGLYELPGGDAFSERERLSRAKVARDRALLPAPVRAALRRL